MALRLYNSLGRKTSTFVPLRKGEVRMYTCGPTVWNYAHIGNFRTFVFEDILRRYLKFKGLAVTQVMNITDVEDKIIKGMKQFHMTRKELSDFYEQAFKDDLAALNMERAEYYPRATENIPEMVEIIKVLLKKGYAYRSEDGSIYFAVSRFKRYGALSGIRPAQLKSGARVSQDSYEKEEANDFALWKAWTPDDGEVFWETELGKGRPGWHVECSAMSMKYLGESFDIHTGGMDNKFPHHENEIAQSEAATGKRFVKFWLHSEFLSIRGEEMHKSVGNIVTLRELLEKGWDPRTIRLFLISAHYRDALNLTDDSLGQAEATVARIDQFVRRLQSVRSARSTRLGTSQARAFLREFEGAMDEDLNVPKALAAFFSFQRNVNSMIDSDQLSGSGSAAVLDALRKIDRVLGIMRFDEEAIPDAIRVLAEEREEARRSRDFARADRIRDGLRQEGFVVEDTPDGPRLKRAAG